MLRAAAKAYGWDARPSPRKAAARGKVLTGRGIAYTYRSNTIAATIAEVEVNRETGRVWARRLVCAHDCGLVINPDALKSQIEGNIVQTLSRTMHEEVKFDDARVTSVDWKSYPILRYPEVPDIAIDLVVRPDEPPLGAGEASAVTVPASLANAVYDAAGVRLRTVPFTRERVKSMLSS